MTVAFALRRSVSNVSSRAFGALICQDIAKDTVLRAEPKAGAAMVASFQHWLDEKQAAAREGLPGHPISVGVFAVRGDATNAAVLRGSKVS